MDAPTNFYRIKNSFSNEGVCLNVEVWKPLRGTPQGYWIIKPNAPTWMEEKKLRKAGYVRWVPTGDHIKRYCYPTIEEAILSFIKRKEHELMHAQLKLEACQMLTNSAADLKRLSLRDFEQSWGGHLSHQLGRVDAMDNFMWE